MAHSSVTNPESQLKDFICTHEDVVDHDLCDLIMSEFKPDDSSLVDSTIMTSNGGTVSDNEYRHSLETCLSHSSVIDVNPVVRKEIDERLFKICTNVWQEYTAQVAPWIRANEDSGYQLLVYGPGCFFKEHTDTLSYPEVRNGEWVHISHSRPRQISISIQLNDDYEGGELSFFNGSYVVPKKKGLLTIFPSFALFPHKVSEIKSGRRYSVVTWFY